jgi:hypothetical protein
MALNSWAEVRAFRFAKATYNSTGAIEADRLQSSGQSENRMSPHDAIGQLLLILIPVAILSLINIFGKRRPS